jgi:DNA-binding NarL/FixJ family response regulator
MAFVLLAGHGSPDVVEDATEMGFDAILLKPFTRDQLRGSVEQVLGGREPR